MIKRIGKPQTRVIGNPLKTRDSAEQPRGFRARRRSRRGLIALILSALPLTALAQPCALPTNESTPGVVRAWGTNSQGQLGNGTGANSRSVVMIGLTDVVQVGAGWLHSVALKCDGTVWTWGDNLVGQLGTGNHADSSVPVQVPGLTGVVKGVSRLHLHSGIEIGRNGLGMGRQQFRAWRREHGHSAAYAGAGLWSDGDYRHRGRQLSWPGHQWLRNLGVGEQSRWRNGQRDDKRDTEHCAARR